MITETVTQVAHLEATFDRLVALLSEQLQAGEQFTVRLFWEQSQFTRFNRARIRQTGSVTDGSLILTLLNADRSNSFEIPFSGNRAIDTAQLQTALAALRQEILQLPVDPHLVLPAGHHTSRDVYQGKLLPPEEIGATLLPIVAGLDFAGIYAAGQVVRAYADSAGQKHWFATDSFSLDYSLFLPDGAAVKGTLAGSEWNPTDYETSIHHAKTQLGQLAQHPKSIARGQYRTYLSPAAMAELISTLSWGGLSEAALQQGRSALAALQRHEKSLSPLFTLRENFQRGLVPRFNEWGEIAPPELPLIQAGQLVNTLVNSRTAKEYGQTANGANSWESPQAPEVNPGSLQREEVLSQLDTGLYVSNLHYLNWSDRSSGRITGMTRYACFWVERGEIVAPIENLRFDESLYRFWGENLIALTQFQEFVPEVGTYGNRQLGGVWTPGALVEEFTYTL